MSNGKRAALTTKLPTWRTARHLEPSKQSFTTFANSDSDFIPCLQTAFYHCCTVTSHPYSVQYWHWSFSFAFSKSFWTAFTASRSSSIIFWTGVESCFLMERFCHRRSQIYQSTCGSNVMWWFISSFARTRKVWTVAFRFVIQIDNDCSKSWICSSAIFRKFARVNKRPIVSL